MSERGTSFVPLERGIAFGPDALDFQTVAVIG
jgi:hypothetical protein